jgi:PAS domain S-box-containing protein
MQPEEKKYMESSEGIDALFTHATEGVLVTNEIGEIIRINPSAERLFGYDKGELIGQKVEVLIPARFSGHHTGLRNEFNKNPHARSMGQGINLFGKHKSGSEVPVEISLSPFSNSNGRFVIAFIVDITIRKQAEEKLKNYSAELEKQVKNRTMILEEAVRELEKTQKSLHQALEKERELSDMKSRFVSMASHEFRTPLATILSSLSLVTKYGEQNDKEKQERHVSKIKSSINNLTDILNDFLSVSRFEEGRVDYMPEPFNLRIFITDVLSELGTLCKPGQQLVAAHTGNDEVVMDKKLLRNILFNFVSNAIKFSPEGKNITVKTVVSETQAKISITDQGIGIPKADQEHLFERFFRGNNATHIQGTGLGLHIVAKYTELMKGRISYESEENKGTTFTVTIPQ